MRALVEVAEIELGIHLRQLAMIGAVNVAFLIGSGRVCFPDNRPYPLTLTVTRA